MSRIGKQQITVPAKTDVTVNGSAVSVKGPKGELARTFHRSVAIALDNNVVSVTPKNTALETHALWGTTAAHIKNMIEGVNEGYTRQLIIEGVGYRAEVRGKDLVLAIGFSHPVTMSIPEGVTVAVEKNVMTVSGIDKEKVGQFAANVRAQKKPEPYKGKGIRFIDEVIRRKEGKKSV